MSRLGELIQQLCPDGVGYKKVGAIAEVGTGGSNGNEASDDGQYPFFIRSQTIKRKNDYEYDDEAIIIPGEGGIGEIFHYINGKYALHQRVYRIHFLVNNVVTKFAYYYMQAYFKPFILKKAVSATVTSIRKPMIEEFAIPLPPLEIQQEIVRILDQFTGFTAELAAELTARKEQYRYYSLSLLNKATAAKRVPLSSLGTWCGGCTPSMANPAFWSNGKIPWVSSKDMKSSLLVDTQDHITQEALTQTPIKLLPKNTVAIVARSGILKHTLPVVFIPFETTVNQDIKALTVSQYVDPRYAYHIINANSSNILQKAKKQGSTVDSLDIQKFMNYLVPLPSLPEQHRIVSILDRFDALCNDLTSGLPAEIEARKKQYEYYRDKLLTFKEKSSDSSRGE